MSRRSSLADRWVPTTCGYCSVGCGMFIGVRDGRAVSVRGNPDHPVNRGHALPQGPVRAPHHRRGESCAVPAAQAGRATDARDLADRTLDDGRPVPRGPGALRPRRGRRHQHGPARHRGVLRARQAGAAGDRHAQLRRQHDAVHVHGGRRLQAIVRQRRPARRLRGLRARRRHPAHRRQHRRQPSDPVPPARSQSRHHAHRRRPAGHQDGDAGRPAPADTAARGPRAAQRPDPHHHRARLSSITSTSNATRPVSTRCGSRSAPTRRSTSRRLRGSNRS